MRRFSGFVLLVVGPALHAQGAKPAPLPDSVIDGAIRVGLEKKEVRIIMSGEAGSSFTAGLLRAGPPSFEVYVEGPVARIQNMAALNARKYMPFTRDSVPVDARMPYVAVRVVPGHPRRSGSRFEQARAIEHVVLQGRGKDAAGNDYPVVQPASITREPVEWKNPLGATYTGEAVTALFDPDKIPAADFDVVIVNAGPESRWRIKRDELDLAARDAAATPSGNLIAECASRDRSAVDGSDQLVTLNDPEGGKCVAFSCRLKGAKDKTAEQAIAKCKDEPSLWERLP